MNLFHGWVMFTTTKLKVYRNSFSHSFYNMGGKLLGRYEDVSCAGLPGLWMNIICETFQTPGKWDSLNVVLKTQHISLVIPSIVLVFQGRSPGSFYFVITSLGWCWWRRDTELKSWFRLRSVSGSLLPCAVLGLNTEAKSFGLFNVCAYPGISTTDKW